jgi:hypothetical protein
MGALASAVLGPLGPLAILAICSLCLMIFIGIGYGVYRFVQSRPRRERQDSEFLLEPQATH